MMDHVGGPFWVPSKGGPPPPFIVTRRGGAHEWGVEVVVFPRIAGVQWSNTVGSTLWGMAAGGAVVLDIVLGPAEITPVVLPAPAGGVVVAGVWSSIYGAVAFSGPGPPGRSAGVHTRRSGGHVEVPDPSRGDVRDSVRVC